MVSLDFILTPWILLVVLAVIILFVFISFILSIIAISKANKKAATFVTRQEYVDTTAKINRSIDQIQADIEFGGWDEDGNVNVGEALVALRTGLIDNTNSIEEIDVRVQTIEDSTGDIGSITTRLDSVEVEVDSLNTDVPAIDTRLTTAEGILGTLGTTVATNFTTLDNAITAVDTKTEFGDISASRVVIRAADEAVNTSRVRRR